MNVPCCIGRAVGNACTCSALVKRWQAIMRKRGVAIPRWRRSYDALIVEVERLEAEEARLAP